MKTITLLFVLLFLPALAFPQGYTFRSLPHFQDEDPNDPNSADGRSITNAGVLLVNYIPRGQYYRAVEILPDGTVTSPKISSSVFAMNLNNRGEIGGLGYDKKCQQQLRKSLGRSIRPREHFTCDTTGLVINDRSGSIHSYSIAGKWINGGGIVNDFGHRAVSVRDQTSTEYFSGAFLGKGDRNPIILDYPGAMLGTWAMAVNNNDDVVGGWLGDGFTEHGYLWSKGQFYSIDVPGSAGSFPTCINNAGDIGGLYWNSNVEPYDYHAFIYSQGAFTTIDFPVPNGVDRLWTDIGGINDKGDIAGTYLIFTPGLLNGVERFAFVATKN